MSTSNIVLYIYGLVWIIVIILIIYLIIKRLKNRSSEDFEKRNN